MKIVFRYILLWIMLSATGPVCAENTYPLYPFRLWPMPQQVSAVAGPGTRIDQLKAIHWRNVQQQPVLTGMFSHLPVSQETGPGVIVFEQSAEAALPEQEEGYVLEVGRDSVKVKARKEVGLFYGYQTLLQLGEDARDLGIPIPACRIVDYPDLAVRALHLDLKHHLDGMHYYYQLIDRLAGWKINHLIVEFEDKLRYRKAPLVGASHAVAIEEFAMLSRYAKERHIEISPLVQGLGHASFILKHKAYESLRDNPRSEWVFDPLHPDTYKVQFALYDDAIAATPYGRFLHVGGDEVGELGASSRAKASGMNAFELQMHWLNEVCNYVVSKGRIPVFWDDMVFDLAGLYKSTYDKDMPAGLVDSLWRANLPLLDSNVHLFPDSCVYMRWNYDTPEVEGNINAINWYRKNKLPVMASTAVQTFWPMMPRRQSNFEPIRSFCRIAIAQKMTGILCAAWDDSSPHYETFMRGIHTFGGLSWHYQELTVTAVHQNYAARFYGHYNGESGNFQDKLEEAMPFWETALLNKGTRNNAPRSMDLVTLPVESNREWSKKYAEKLQKARVAVVNYKQIKTAIGKATGSARRNLYALQLWQAINELQIYPASLLLALERYDVAPAGEKKKYITEIGTIVQHFPTLREQFEAVFGETRMLGNPVDYLEDKNVPNHLAAATANSDWMYIYELAFNEKVKKWLADK